MPGPTTAIYVIKSGVRGYGHRKVGTGTLRCWMNTRLYAGSAAAGAGDNIGRMRIGLAWDG